MGLEQFTSGDADPEPDDQDEKPDNNHYPSYADHRFTDKAILSPREIKYQIKSVGGKWKRTFTTLRFERAELVMYSAGKRTTKDDLTVMVFTTISSELDGVKDYGPTDIRVTPWDFEVNDNIGQETMISYSDDWKEVLIEEIFNKIDWIDRRVE